MISFHGTGLSVAPEITFSDISASCQNPEEVRAVYTSSTWLMWMVPVVCFLIFTLFCYERSYVILPLSYALNHVIIPFYRTAEQCGKLGQQFVIVKSHLYPSTFDHSNSGS